MTISSQTLTEAEKNKFLDLFNGKRDDDRVQMEKTLGRIVQTAINGAGQAEADNIKSRIARALRQTFNL
jgi:hypothetical protein